MNLELKVIAVGNSSGVILPVQCLDKLRVKKGDKLYCVETPNGIEITAYRPEFAEQMVLGEEILRENRELLRRLAQ